MLRAPRAGALDGVNWVPGNQRLPRWIENGLERAFSEVPDGPVDEAVVAVIAADLVATLGWTPTQADDVARRTACVHIAQRANEVHLGHNDLAFDVAEDVQQWLQDTFLDAT